MELSHVPTVTVTVGIGGHTGTDLTLSGLSASSTLTFDSSNWNSPRTVTVTAAHDADAVNDRETLTHTASGGEYGDVTRELPVTVDDDEETGVVLSPESLGPVAEGATRSYTGELSSEPTATTTVGITGHGDASIALSGLSASSTLTFTASNWDTPQTVTVTATQDPDAVDDECHPHPHRQRRGLRERHGEADRHGGRRRGDRPEAVRDLAGAGGGRGRNDLHREADEPAHGRSHSHLGGTRRYRPHPVRGHTDLHGLKLERGADRDRDRGGGPGRGRRHGHADPRGQRRGLRRRHEGIFRSGWRTTSRHTWRSRRSPSPPSRGARPARATPSGWEASRRRPPRSR